MAPSRGVLIPTSADFFISRKCYIRDFTTASPLWSGHNRWSKIRHDKAKVDSAKNRQRSIFAQEIATASRNHGPHPNSNPRLADVITKAKREGFAKASIEAAIARGQGRTAGGQKLESVTVEGMLPGSIGVVIECETDNKARTLTEVRHVIKEAGGRDTSTAFLFERKGKVVFESKDGVGMEEAMEVALDAGAVDVEQAEDGAVVIICLPGETKAMGETVATALGLQIQRAEIFWSPNPDTAVDIESEAAVEELESFIDELQEKEPNVQSVSMNIAPAELQNRLAI